VKRVWLGLGAVAVALVGLHLLLGAAGLRADVGVLSGTLPASDAARLGGVLYALSWFAAAVAAPIVAVSTLLGATLEAIFRRLT
jgi:hypothetical protein